MTPADRRAAVRDSARYLRGVRPLDPTEIAQYVPGEVDPGVVRDDLRALATELDIVDQGDGTYVPVPTGTIPTPDTPLTTLPDEIVASIESLIAEWYGDDWAEGSTGEAFRSKIDQLKADYYRQHNVEYDREVAVAYTLYHFASTFAMGYYVVADLANSELLPYRLRVLDVGAGVGGPALGMMAAVPQDALVEYHAVEPGAGTDVLEHLLQTTGPNVHATIEQQTAEEYDPTATYDLILFANVVSELDDPSAVLPTYLEAVRDDGTLVLVAPADKETSTGLRALERTLVDDRDLATVYAPTVRLWPNERPSDRGWSFIRHPSVDPPSFQRRLAGDDETYTHTSVQYSYSYLRRDGRQRYPVTLSRDVAVKMAEMGDHVTNRVDVVAAKLSPDLGDENPLYKVSDGSESVDHYAVLVHESSLTEQLITADYGALLSFEHVLVLWNDDEEGYNLVVDDEAVVDYY